MPGSQLHVHLYRDSFDTPWGFRLQGGKDLNSPLVVQRVFSNSPAEKELQRGDVILAIGGEATNKFSHKGAQDAIKNSGGQINLVVSRPPPGCVNISPISPPTPRPRAPSLQDEQSKPAEANKEETLPEPPGSSIQPKSVEAHSILDLQQRFLRGLQDECTPGAAEYVKRRLYRLKAIARAMCEGHRLRDRLLAALCLEHTPATIPFIRDQIERLHKHYLAAIDLSPSSPNPRRPNNIPYNQKPQQPQQNSYGQHHNHPQQHHNRHNQQHHSPSSHHQHHQHQNNTNMNHHPRKQYHHNQPIHVHIEPSRPTSQTTYYLHTPSPQPQQQRQPNYFQSNNNHHHDPYGTMPRQRQHRGYSQPPFQSPTTPTIPPPPWATQQASPKKVSKLSRLGGGGALFGTSYRSSTLPRHASHHDMAQHYARRPQHGQDDEADAPDLFAEKRPTGPPPKVCHLGNLGGGGINFASGPNESHTLPRRTTQRRLSQPPNMPSRSPYGVYQGATTPAQRFEPSTQRFEPSSQSGVMLNRVQSSLDNITLSPRTPDGTQQRTPFYQAPGQDRQFYTPTSLLLEQQQKMEEEENRRMHQQQQARQYQPQAPPQQQQNPQYPHHMQQQPPQQQHYNYQPQPQQQQYGGGQQDEVDEGEEDEPIVPVWERRKQFQPAPPPTKPKTKPGVRTPKTNPVPKVSRPAPGKTNYSDFGQSYRPQNKTSSTTWQPVPSPKPAHAPPPQVVHYSSAPAPQHHAAGPQSPVKSAPPPWQRQQANEDETDGTPAWRNTLRTTGVKPWDVDLDYEQQGYTEPQRSDFNPTPYHNLYAPGMGTDATDSGAGGEGGDGNPKIVHLQYNSPMGLYSKENVDETYKGQVSGLTGQQEPQQPQGNQNQGQGQGQGLPGGRDWSQSQVLQFIQQDKGKKPKGKTAPAPAPKPHAALQQPQQQQQQQRQQQPQHQQHHHQPPPQQRQQQQQHYQQPYHADVGISDF